MKLGQAENQRDIAAGIFVILVRAAVTLLFLSCVMFIWHNSMENAAESSARSGRITDVINEILEQGGQAGVTEHFIRKLAHFSEYGAEGVLTVLLFVVYCLKPEKRWKGVVLTGVFTAGVDESIQFFSAGRSPGIGDVCIDTAGFICGMLAMMIIYRLIRRAAEKHGFRNETRRKAS